MSRIIRSVKRSSIFFIILVFVLTTTAYGQRTRLKPGWNLFSPQQDVELGQQVSQDAERQLPMLNKSRVDNYLNKLGKRLAAYAPGERYPYQFKCVNDASINAFALPGGYLYVNRGLIEAADNEAELAGVIGHEIGHVALRHGTNQASKQQLVQAPLAIFGGIMGKDSMAGVLTQIGGGFAVNSILLKYSRDDERQADLIGAQILHDAGYDPNYMAKFFENLETGHRGTEFFSSHPNPDNRIRGINQEIDRLGPFSATAINDSAEFRSIRKYLKSLPPAPKAAGQSSGGATSSSPAPVAQPSSSRTASSVSATPDRPSSQFKNYSSGYMRLQHPDNWKVYGTDRDFTLAPDKGIVNVGNGGALAYGVMMSVYQDDSRGGAALGLEAATEQLMRNIQQSNPRMRLAGNLGKIRVGGAVGLLRQYSNDSPIGGKETDWVVTVMRPEGLVYFIFVAPEQEFSAYKSSFEKIIRSVRF